MFFQTESQAITVPLSFEAHAIAQGCYEQLANVQKAKQVYLNSLAIYAVDYYLRLMDFETDWANSDSRNPIMLKLMDIADLDLKQIGKLECRPVLVNAEVCKIPPEVWEDRLGYVIVELNPSLKAANILGFSVIAQPEISLDQLESVEALLNTLVTLEQKNVCQTPTINLRDWLNGRIEDGWQQLENLLAAPQQELAFGFRNTMSLGWGKKVDLGLKLLDNPMALVVTLPNAAEAEMSVAMQVHPMEQMYLPEGVELSISDELGVQFSTQSREADNFIQLKVSAEPGETFQVTVIYGDEQMTQEFST
jgi:hypothetical protein